MAMTLKEVSTIFTELDFEHKLIEEKDLILSAGGNKNNRLAYYIRCRDEDKTFDMAAQLLDDETNHISVKGSQHMPTLMAYLLLRNYQTKFGTWELDPEDGDIKFTVEIPLEDNTLTKAQLKRIIKIMNSTSDEAKDIKSIVATGKLPLDEDEAAKKIAELEAMLAQLQGSGI
ncbi:YbjN domain-containing protein [Sulfurimonas sp. SAG-AH-194-C21]|nr:YbjN domain-containing protein [Sulfurimonas sp. SAG-AH-194-C21]MDF1884109.1 YbjN domain-containing protein [Sulfurimonas sp. SAG-AH-194-C21]